MNVARVVLIESIDASGAAAPDARARARALTVAGCETRCAIVTPAPPDERQGQRVPADTLMVPAGAAGRAALLEWMAAAKADAVLVASALCGGGAAGRWVVDAGPPAWWWPTGIAAADAGDPGASAERDAGGGPLPILPGAGFDGTAGEPWPGACAGLEASLLADARAPRGLLPLWDGDYVLVPAPLSGAAGGAAVDAFATLCASHDGLDLVVLADPQPAFERLARARGVGFRVHFAGPAPRDAERAWLSGASAALIAGDAPLSGGLVLRALASGCPLLAAPGAASAAPLEAWLAARGTGCGAPAAPLAARLARALDRDTGWRARVATALVRHGVEAMGGRLANALERRRRDAA